MDNGQEMPCVSGGVHNLHVLARSEVLTAKLQSTA